MGAGGEPAEGCVGASAAGVDAVFRYVMAALGDTVAYTGDVESGESERDEDETELEALGEGAAHFWLKLGGGEDGFDEEAFALGDGNVYCGVGSGLSDAEAVELGA